METKQPLKDNDLMPFGKYKNTPMVNLTASYLIWLKDYLNKSSMDENGRRVLAYINSNWAVIQQEGRSNKSFNNYTKR